MHPRKSKLLVDLEETSRWCDRSLHHTLDLLRHPRAGWRDRLATFTIGLPISLLGAVLTDLAYVIAAGTPDATWEQAYPTGTDGEDDVGST